MIVTKKKNLAFKIQIRVFTNHACPNRVGQRNIIQTLLVSFHVGQHNFREDHGGGSPVEPDFTKRRF